MTLLQAAAIIPARMGAQRLPGKPIADLGGRPLVVRVAQQAERARCVSHVAVAACEAEVIASVQAHGIRAIPTRANHVSGSDRVAEAAAGLDAEIIVNVQGDEPFVDPADLDALLQTMAHAGWEMATLARPLAAAESLDDPNLVKVVRADAGQALYFSRAAIPHRRAAAGQAPSALRHLGVYAWRRATLMALAAAPPHPLELCEGLEQLRALARGVQIGVVLARGHGRGIDTPADLAWARERVAMLGAAAFPGGDKDKA